MPRGTDVSEMKRTYRTAVADEFPYELNIGLLKEAGLRYGDNTARRLCKRLRSY